MTPIEINGQTVSDVLVNGESAGDVTVNGDSVFSAIPDSDVYLHDDWGDDRLTDREDSGTTTHNGEEGVYRPEWTLDSGDPTASNDMLVIQDGDAIYTDINLNLDETITWEYTIDLSESGTSSADEFGLTLWSETNNRVASDRFLDKSWIVGIRREQGGDSIRFRTYDDGFGSTLITGDHDTDVFDLDVIREPDGDWELFVNDSSIGSTNDTTTFDVEYIGFGGSDDSDVNGKTDEIKVR